ncbi:MAG: N-acetylmuramoyl-L-alanine amidase [Kiritimatiellae bacterium]|nr:N-acetylmuramoyl-L-alanine amidase [Kiritimatiellia bacterium]
MHARILTIGLSAVCLAAGAVSGRAATNEAPPSTLVELATAFEFAAPVREEDRIVLRKTGRVLAFDVDTRRLLCDDVLVWLSRPVVRHRGDWRLDGADFEHVVRPLLDPRSLAGAPGGRTVVLDPGHGGNDPGAVSPGGLEEKTIVLELAERVKALLEKAGLTVKLTRERDDYLALKERVRRAGEWKADVLVSIHLNSHRDRRARGLETFVLPPAGCPVTGASTLDARDKAVCPGNTHDAANASLGFFLQRGLVQATGGEDRGLKRARYFLLREAPCPAAVTECKFLSNHKAEEELKKDEHLAQIAKGLSDGIRAYVDIVGKAKEAAARKPDHSDSSGNASSY